MLNSTRNKASSLGLRVTLSNTQPLLSNIYIWDNTTDFGEILQRAGLD
jgi:hypothetical protein